MTDEPAVPSGREIVLAVIALQSKMALFGLAVLVSFLAPLFSDIVMDVLHTLDRTGMDPLASGDAYLVLATFQVGLYYFGRVIVRNRRENRRLGNVLGAFVANWTFVATLIGLLSICGFIMYMMFVSMLLGWTPQVILGLLGLPVVLGLFSLSWAGGFLIGAVLWEEITGLRFDIEALTFSRDGQLTNWVRLCSLWSTVPLTCAFAAVLLAPFVAIFVLSLVQRPLDERFLVIQLVGLTTVILAVYLLVRTVRRSRNVDRLRTIIGTTHD